MRPKRNGSSHSGGMKSVVAIRARPSSRNTPASSPVSGPTRTRASPPRSRPASGPISCARSPGPTLAAQPPVLAHPVRRNAGGAARFTVVISTYCSAPVPGARYARQAAVGTAHRRAVGAAQQHGRVAAAVGPQDGLLPASRVAAIAPLGAAAGARHVAACRQAGRLRPAIYCLNGGWFCAAAASGSARAAAGAPFGETLCVATTYAMV